MNRVRRYRQPVRALDDVIESLRPVAEGWELGARRAVVFDLGSLPGVSLCHAVSSLL